MKAIKKCHILVAGLIVLMALLLCTVAAQAEDPQPSKTAAQWESEG